MVAPRKRIDAGNQSYSLLSFTIGCLKDCAERIGWTPV